MATQLSRGFLLGVALLAPALAAGCATPAPAPHPDVLASFYPMHYLAERVVGGGRLTLGTIIPADAEPHDYDLKPSDAANIAHARLLVLHGAGLEIFADKLPQLAKESGVRVVEAAEGLEARTRDLGDEGEAADPHLWLDPVAAQQEARNIARGIEAIDPANASEYQRNLAALVADLQGLDAAYQAGLAHCEKHVILTSHAAFGYLADRYDFTQHAIAGVSPDAQPSAADLQSLAELARRENITVIFFEALVSPSLAEAIASQVHARTEVLDPIEGLTSEEAAAGTDYLGLMRQNLGRLRDAMVCA